MPIQKSAFKELRKNRKKTKRNKIAKSRLEALVRKTRKLISQKEVKTAAELLKESVKLLDQVAGKGIIKKNTAARKKSRLTKAFNLLR